MTYQQTLDEIERDFAVSYWLKRAARALDGRDPVDALYDARALAALQEARLSEFSKIMPLTSADAIASKEHAKRIIQGAAE